MWLRVRTSSRELVFDRMVRDPVSDGFYNQSLKVGTDYCIGKGSLPTPILQFF